MRGTGISRLSLKSYSGCADIETYELLLLPAHQRCRHFRHIWQRSPGSLFKVIWARENARASVFAAPSLSLPTCTPVFSHTEWSADHDTD